MASYVQIANRAAIAVGTSARLNAPGDNTVLGRAVAAVWDIERRAALRADAWNFATTRAELAKLVAPPKFGYENLFELPADCIKLIELEGIERHRYAIEGRKILSDEDPPLRIRYLRDVTEPAEFDESFAQAFALRIAMAIGGRIAGSTFDKQKVFNEYRDALALARSSDALESPPIEQEESEWVTARFTGGLGDYGTLSGWVDGG